MKKFKQHMMPFAATGAAMGLSIHGNVATLGSGVS